MTEQFRFEERVADRGAIQFDELAFPAIGKIVQARGDQFLAGAAFADDQHRLVEGRRAGHILEDVHDGPGFAEQTIMFVVHAGDSANKW